MSDNSNEASISLPEQQTMKRKCRNALVVAAYLAAVCALGALVIEVWHKLGTERVDRFETQARSDLAKAAQYGDSFGYVNSLFSGLAFAGVIITILLQWNELRLQRHEIDESQKTWKETADAQKASHEALKEQAGSLLLASYLNALAAVSSTPTALSADQRRSLARIRSLIPFLEQRVKGQVGRLAIEDRELIARDCERLATRLQTLVELYDEYNEKHVDHLKEVLKDIELEVNLLIGELPTQSHAVTILRSLDELEGANLNNLTRGNAKILPDVFLQFRQQIRNKVILELQSLANSCRTAQKS